MEGKVGEGMTDKERINCRGKGRGSYYSGRVTSVSKSKGRDGRGRVGGVKYSGLVTSEERREGEGVAAGMIGKVRYNCRVSSTKNYIARDKMFENRGPIKTFSYNPLILKLI